LGSSLLGEKEVMGGGVSDGAILKSDGSFP